MAVVFPASLSLVLTFPWAELPCSARLGDFQSGVYGGDFCLAGGSKEWLSFVDAYRPCLSNE